MSAIRVSAKAIIIKEDKILLIKNKDENGYWYSLPGGGQQHQENLVEAVIRECKEEVGVDIKVGNVKFIRDYIGKNHEFHLTDSHQHQVEIMFECFLTEDTTPTMGAVPDENQIGYEWVLLSEISNYRLYPKALITQFSNYNNSNPIYIGDVN